MRPQQSLAFMLCSVLLSGCARATPPVSSEGPIVAPPAAGPWVIDFQDGTGIETARAAVEDPSVDWFHPRAADDAILVMDALTTRQYDRLATHPALEVLEPSLEYRTMGYPDDPMRDRQWNFDRVGAEDGWRLSQGAGIIVAVIDTGVSVVPDLSGTSILDGVSFVRGEDTAADGNGHGTHVAGTIAQTTHNGIGVAGIAPSATILPLKALSATGNGQSEWVAAAIDEAGDQGAHIINLSLGGPRSSVIARAVEKAQARGVLVIAAAGNTGREGVGSPAVLPGVVAVSATGPSDQKAPYSTYGPEVVLSAPGGDKRQAGGGILQDTVDKSGTDGHAYKEFQGTSMATPHVAGAAALIMASTGGGADYVKVVMARSALDLGEAGHDPVFGHGRLDVASAARFVALRERGAAFAVSAMLAWLLTGLFGPSRARRRVALTAGLVAGGVFFLPLLPLSPSPVIDLLGRPLLLWPDVLFGAGWSRSPLVLSAALPMVATFLLGPSRTLGPWVAGLSAGIGGHLLFGAATGSLATAWLSGGAGLFWIIANGVVATGCAIITLGVQRMSERSGDSA